MTQLTMIICLCFAATLAATVKADKITTEDFDTAPIYLEKEQLTQLKSSGPILDSYLSQNGFLWMLSKKSIWKWDLKNNKLSLIDFNENKKFSFQKIIIRGTQAFIATHQGVIFYSIKDNSAEYVGISKYGETTSLRLSDSSLLWSRKKSTYEVSLKSKIVKQLAPKDNNPTSAILDGDKLVSYSPKEVTVFDQKTKQPLQKIVVRNNKEILKASFRGDFHTYVFSDQSAEIYDLKEQTRRLGKVFLDGHKTIDKVQYSRPFLTLQSNGSIYAYAI